MQQFYKENKTLKQANAYLKKIGLEDFILDEGAVEKYGEFDYDGWINEEKTRGVSVRIEKDFTVIVSKYTDKDIKKLNRELEILDADKFKRHGIAKIIPSRCGSSARARTTR